MMTVGYSRMIRVEVFISLAYMFVDSTTERQALSIMYIDTTFGQSVKNINMIHRQRL